MAKKNTIWLSYDEIDEILKDEIREHYLTGDFVVPDDWFEMAYDVFEENFPMFDINRDDIEMDIYRNEYKITGSLNTSNNNIPPLPEEFLEYYDKEWVYDMMFDFHNNTFSKDFNIDTEVIYSNIESEIFPDIIEVENGKIDLFTTKFEQPLKNALIKYKNLENDEINEILERWIREIDAANIFFVETITINVDDYDLLLNELTNEIENKIANLVEETYDLYQPLLDDFYDKFRDHFKESYESYYSNESADGHLAYRKFEIVVDENNNQLDVVDLDGEF